MLQGFSAINLKLTWHQFFTLFMLQRKAYSVPYEPLAIPDGDGSSLLGKSLESAEQSLSEEGKGSCCSQWN